MTSVYRPLALCMSMLCLWSLFSMAADTYVGDTVIYGGESSSVKPNVLILMDKSGSMDNEVSGSSYTNTNEYTSSASCWDGAGLTTCKSDSVYEIRQYEGADYYHEITNLSNVTNDCDGENIQSVLQDNGQWISTTEDIQTSGQCTSGEGVYKLGNYIHWENDTSIMQPKIDIARQVLTNLLQATSGVNFGVITFKGDPYEGGEFITESVDDSNYVTTIKDMSEDHTSSKTNKEALLDIVSRFDTAFASGSTPLAETLIETTRYFQGKSSSYSTAMNYISPITARCQKNYVIVLTDGMSTKDETISSWFTSECGDGDCDNDGHEPGNDENKSYPHDGSDYLDDVAWYLSHNDQSETYAGDQKVKVYTVGFGLDPDAVSQGADLLLAETAQNGGGTHYSTENAGGLSAALSNILSEIVDVNHTFTSPVVPSNPDNRSYSGDRMYVGLFSPKASGRWSGNLKKYQIGSAGILLDQTGVEALDSDETFRETSRSYWSASADGADIEKGGVGEVLKARTTARLLLSNLSTCTDGSFVCDENKIETANGAISTSLLNVTSEAEKNNIIHYLHGLDGFDEDADNNRTEKRAWLMGDILHSQPTAISYKARNNSSATEANTSLNKTVIYALANDGMLHAFWDANGEEIWGFVPDVLLPELKGFADENHNYYLDATPIKFVKDFDNDGNIGEHELNDGDSDNGSNDLALLIFGLRRGGRYYYVLDVTNPEKPKFLWKLSSAMSGLSELGQSWSQPSLGLVKHRNVSGTVSSWLTLFIGAGYDNENEDGRFGVTQLFTNTTISGPTSDAGDISSTGTYRAVELTNSPKGRGVFAVGLATRKSITNGYRFTLPDSPTVLWRAIYNSTASSTDNLIRYSVPGGVMAIDTNYDTYIDRLYWADTGGQLWRSCEHQTVQDITSGDDNEIADNSSWINSWTNERIFTAGNNGGTENAFAASSGRKFFYQPDVTREKYGIFSVFIGSGDRAHPLNTSVIDRLYRVNDRGQDTSDSIGESRLVDLTQNQLQDAATDAADRATVLQQLSLYQPNSSAQKFGWRIDLDQTEGEKVLSSPTVFNKVAYFTTFTANSASNDPCAAGNLGQATVYEVDDRTGEAVFNYTTSNDSENTDTNNRASGGEDVVLRRADRKKTLGSGIPSSVTVILRKGQTAEAYIGTGASVKTTRVKAGGRNKTMYWMQR